MTDNICYVNQFKSPTKGFFVFISKIKSSSYRTELAGFLLLFVFALTRASAAIASWRIPFSPFFVVSRLLCS